MLLYPSNDPNTAVRLTLTAFPLSDIRSDEAFNSYRASSLSHPLPLHPTLSLPSRRRSLPHVHRHEPISGDPGEEEAFEQVWLSRDSYLAGVPGFVEFHMLRGPAADDHVLYSSHTVWLSRGDFENWTRSEAFRAAHRGAGDHKLLYLAPPRFEGFDVIQTVTPS